MDISLWGAYAKPISKIKFSYRCSHLMRPHPMQQEKGAHTYHPYFSEQFLHWEMALRFTVKNLMRGMHEMRATKTEFYFRSP